ncbi:hypothetical protein [uncultured Clostridium sp.]|uniref:hypothetical protein n=1 Tax=uncultured Clostridium sp. TaxID=59620 RepID=UPI00260ABA8E|nr:hypothetical protein [uncultured Clostridium sp.]
MAHNKLYRNFIILQEDEGNALSGDKAVSGYSKIEAKGDKCKITFYAQNLKKDDNHSIVLICCKKGEKQIIDMGPLVVADSGKGEATKEYFIDNIAGMNMSHEKISGAGICKNVSGKLNFMLYGFMNGEKPETGWKDSPIVKSDEKKATVKPKVEEKPKEEKPKVKSKTDFESYERSIEDVEIDPNNFKLRGGIGGFFENIVKDFEEIKECFKEIKYCKWYKVPIKAIDDMCNMNNHEVHSVVYNPMINYYPYIIRHKHFMMGYKCDNKGELKHIIYAIPGKKNTEEQPYMGKSGFVTWIKGQNGDEDGYWLMFYDYKKATVVIPTK